MNVVGLDLSTSRIGFASASGELLSITARAGAADPYRRLHELRREVARTFTLRPPRPDLVVVEDYSLGGPGRLSMIRLGEIGGIIRTWLFENDIVFVLVRPTTLKRFATGKGNATKEDMLKAANTRRLAAGELCPANDDEADAYHLRRMGRAACALEPNLTDYETDALSVVQW